MIVSGKDYPTEKIREELIYKLYKKFNLLRIKVSAKSLCSRAIYRLDIGNTKKNPVLFVGAFHGMEWITSLILLRFTEKTLEILSSDGIFKGLDLKKLLAHSGIVIIPCVNPDGVEISLNGVNAAKEYKNLVYKVCNGDTLNWQANARGVDLNHNFDADWNTLHLKEIENGIKSASKTRYGGEHPHSEPETIFLTDLCKKMNFRSVFAFHTQGEEIFWNFGDNTPAKSLYIAKILSSYSGYKISNPEGLAIGGGFKDWFIKSFSNPGFTIELGKGKNPLPIEDFEKIYNKTEHMLFLASIL